MSGWTKKETAESEEYPTGGSNTCQTAVEDRTLPASEEYLGMVVGPVMPKKDCNLSVCI